MLDAENIPNQWLDKQILSSGRIDVWVSDAKVNQTSPPFTVHDTTNGCLYLILRSCDIIDPMWLRKHSYSTNPNQLQQSWYIPITSQPQLNNPDRNPYENHPHRAENLPTSPAVAPRFPRPEIAMAARFFICLHCRMSMLSGNEIWCIIETCLTYKHYVLYTKTQNMRCNKYMQWWAMVYNFYLWYVIDIN